jgi:hypothetical protein
VSFFDIIAILRICKVILPLGNQVTNRHLQREIYRDFLNWAIEEGHLFLNFNSVASCLEDFYAIMYLIINYKESSKLVAENRMTFWVSAIATTRFNRA